MFSYQDQLARSQDYRRYAREYIERERLVEVARSASPKPKGLITWVLSHYGRLNFRQETAANIELKPAQYRSAEAE